MDPKNTDVSSESTKDRYKLEELADLLKVPVDKVRTWLQAEGIEPISADRPDEYHAEALRRWRERTRGI